MVHYSASSKIDGESIAHNDHLRCRAENKKNIGFALELDTTGDDMSHLSLYLSQLILIRSYVILSDPGFLIPGTFFMTLVSLHSASVRTW